VWPPSWAARKLSVVTGSRNLIEIRRCRDARRVVIFIGMPKPQPSRPRLKPHRPKPPFKKQKQQQGRSGQESKLAAPASHDAPDYRPADKLKGKVALITGGDSGIGRAVAILFAREGADVAIVYLPDDQQDAEATAVHIELEGRRALLIPGDVTSSQFCDDAVKRTVRELGKLDILVNNAGYARGQERIEDITDEQLDRTVKTNLYGYFYMARAAIPRMKRGGSIIMTGSISAIESQPTLIDYAMTKAANHALVKSLSQGLIEKGIRVNCVAPGPVWTPLATLASGDDDGAKDFGKDAPMKRPAQPDELAPAYVYFASNADSSYVSGATLLVYGGKPSPV
jgi:NAD(P)-dependent dehydrogenase (short-subunit alcohol dehydrogenase family)